LRARNLPAE